MGSLSIWHLIILLVIIMVLFGAGRIPRVMGDLAKGIKSFKAGMKDEEVAAEEPAKRVEGTTIDGKPTPAPTAPHAAPHPGPHHPESTAPKV
jgi:sec-independent protein translocase protein TatA